MFEEMGISCPLKEVFSFCYCVTFPNGLTENEHDHVLVGKSEGSVKPNPKEVEEYKWVSMKFLKSDIDKNPEIYTYWFKILLEKLPEKIASTD